MSEPLWIKGRSSLGGYLPPPEEPPVLKKLREALVNGLVNGAMGPKVEPTWQEVMRALEHNAGLFAHDAPYIDIVDLKRELRAWCKQARKILAMEKRKTEGESHD